MDGRRSGVAAWWSSGFVALVTAVVLGGGCGQTASDASSSGALAVDVATAFPAVRDLLAAARAPERVGDAGGTQTILLDATRAPRATGAWSRPPHSLRARVPSSGTEEYSLAVDGDGPSVGIRRVGATPARAVMEGRTVALRDAAPGVDAVLFALDGGVEELLHVRTPAANAGYELDLPGGYAVRKHPAGSGLVEIVDAAGIARLRMRADRAWDASGREVEVGVSVTGSRIDVAIGAAARWPVVVDPTWETTGTMAVARSGASTTLLSNGKVLVAGGSTGNGAVALAELFDPLTSTFTSTASLAAARVGHTATALLSGRVLLAGGHGASSSSIASTELFAPDASGGFGAFSAGPSMSSPRESHTASRLASGKVVIIGGLASSSANTLATAEVYDPATNSFSTTGSMSTPRNSHAATVLPDGRVLVAGGGGWASGAPTRTATAEIFDPSAAGGAGGFVPTGPLSAARTNVSMITLRDGNVLAAGGFDGTTVVATAERFDPLASAGAGAFTTIKDMTTARSRAQLAVLPSGSVLIAGGEGVSMYLASAEIFAPVTDTFASTTAMSVPRVSAGSALLPSGRVVVIGGWTSNAGTGTPTAEVFDPAGTGNQSGAFATGPPLGTKRTGHAITQLLDGRLLISGGASAGMNAEIFDPAANGGLGAMAPGPAMLIARSNHTATLLPSGKVLITGGATSTQCEVFDPSAGPTGAFVATGSMTQARTQHAAALLPTGKVLVTGGADPGSSAQLKTTEIFDPAANAGVGAFSAGPTMGAQRRGHSMTLLPTGEVLIAGGQFGQLAELYDLFANGGAGALSWTGSMMMARERHTATLLPSGRVLFAGGRITTSDGSTELYDRTGGGGLGTFKTGPPLSSARGGHTATLLPDGRVLIAGGFSTTWLSTAELFDPVLEVFRPTGSMNGARWSAAAALLPSGKVFIAGGMYSTAWLSSTELFSPVTGAQLSWMPSVSGVPSPMNGGSTVAITGSGFAPLLEGTTGGGRSGTGAVPNLVWLPFAGGTLMGSTAPWTGSMLQWHAPASSLHGPGLLFVGVNGVLSAGTLAVLAASADGAACVHAADCASGYCADGVCCDKGCSGICEACSASKKGSGADGVCASIVAGTDPDAECAAQPASSCGFTGVCDGAGACQRFSPGTVCISAVCSGTLLTPAGLCSGSGTCAPGSTVNCFPYVCSLTTGACTGSCVSSTDCAAGAFCGGGLCRAPQTNGAPCTAGGQCASTFCVDGVCCDKACAGACEACTASKTLASADGICDAIEAGTDPDDECPDDGPGSCQRDGFCNGSAACRLYAPGTVCAGTPYCVGNVATYGKSCDGFGTCAAQSTGSDCAPYACKAGQCPSTCSGDADCAAGSWCDGGTCKPEAGTGAPCSTPSACASGFCVEGVCCDTACNGICQACTAANQASTADGGAPVDGVCGVAKVGVDPHDDCPDDGAPSCKRDGLCDGAGACRDYVSGTACGVVACVGNVPTSYTCNGSGTCLPSAAADCAPYACSGGACATACTALGDCAGNAWCDGGVCKPKSGLGEPCTTKGSCSSNICADGVCCNAGCQGQCEACNEVGTEGTCTPVSGEPRAGHPACPGGTASDPCSASTCNGTDRSACAGYVGSSVRCRQPSCTDGVATLAASCDGYGHCPDIAADDTKKCEPYVCAADTCKVSCVADADCAPGSSCDEPSGKCVSGSSCDGDHTVSAPNGTPTDCSPFKCEGSACKSSCSSIDDCVVPAVCDSTNRCVPPALIAAPDAGSACGCELPGRPGRDGGCAWLVAAVVALARPRRRRAGIGDDRG